MRNNLSIAAFIISIVSVYSFSVKSVSFLIMSTALAVISLALGIISLKQIKKNGQKGKGWAIAATIIGACGVLIAISSFLAILNR